MLATLPSTLNRLAADTLARCNTHPDSCPCGLCKLQSAVNEAAWRAEVAARDSRCWAVRWWKWDSGTWELVEERNYTHSEAERRADSLNQNAGEDDPQAEAFNQEEFDDDVCEVQRGRLDLVSAGAAPAAVQAVLRHGAGAVRLPAGA